MKLIEMHLAKNREVLVRIASRSFFSHNSVKLLRVSNEIWICVRMLQMETDKMINEAIKWILKRTEDGKIFILKSEAHTLLLLVVLAFALIFNAFMTNV